MTTTRIALIRAFAASFGSTLYDTGFAYAVEESLLAHVEDMTSACEALSYIAGCARTAEESNRYIAALHRGIGNDMSCATSKRAARVAAIMQEGAIQLRTLLRMHAMPANLETYCKDLTDRLVQTSKEST